MGYRDREGRNLCDYHVGLYDTPATRGYRLIPPDLPSEPERARTPLPDSPIDLFEPAPPEDSPSDMVAEDGPVDRQESAVSAGGVEQMADMPLTSEGGAGIGLPQLEKEVPMISYENQGELSCRKM